MFEVKKIDVLSLALMWALVIAAISLVMGILILLLLLVGATIIGGITQETVRGMGDIRSFTTFLLPLSFFYILVLPIITGIAGFIQGIVAGIIYNWLAPKIGGVKIEIWKVKEK